MIDEWTEIPLLDRLRSKVANPEQYRTLEWIQRSLVALWEAQNSLSIVCDLKVAGATVNADHLLQFLQRFPPLIEAARHRRLRLRIFSQKRYKTFLLEWYAHEHPLRPSRPTVTTTEV